jgi:DNA-binding MarR family transcriptional regulator
MVKFLGGCVEWSFPEYAHAMQIKSIADINQTGCLPQGLCMYEGECFLRPRQLAELLLFRLYRVHATAGPTVIRLCETRCGVTRREWRVLASVAENEGVLSSELAVRALLDRARTSRTLTTLTDKRLIRREPRPGNRREVQVFLTDAGRALHAVLFPQIAVVNEHLIQGLSAQDRATLDRLLTTLQLQADRMAAQAVLPITPVPIAPLLANGQPTARVSEGRKRAGSPTFFGDLGTK